VERVVLRGGSEYCWVSCMVEKRYPVKDTETETERWACLEMAIKTGLSGKKAIDAAKLYHEYITSKKEE
jgi:hypothetical protein